MSLGSLFRVFVTGTALFAFSCGGGSSDGTSSGSPSGSGSGTGITAGIDGTWDITAAGSGDIGPSEMTIANGTVTGFIADRDEGKESDGCTNLKYRAEFRLTFEGNALSGTITSVRAYEGGAQCTEMNRNDVTPMSGSRTNAGSGLSGDWEVTVGGEAPFVVAVDGLTAKAWDKKAKANGKEPTVNVSVAGGNATVTDTKKTFSLAARKR